MERIAEKSFKGVLRIFLAQFTKTIGNCTFRNLKEWDTNPQLEKFDLRKRIVSFSYDFVAGVLIFGILTMLFY